MSGEWTADQWLAWLRRSPSESVPSRQGMNDCAGALEQEILGLRALVIKLSAEGKNMPYSENKSSRPIA